MWEGGEVEVGVESRGGGLVGAEVVVFVLGFGVRA